MYGVGDGKRACVTGRYKTFEQARLHSLANTPQPQRALRALRALHTQAKYVYDAVKEAIDAAPNRLTKEAGDTVAKEAAENWPVGLGGRVRQWDHVLGLGGWAG